MRRFNLQVTGLVAGAFSYLLSAVFVQAIAAPLKDSGFHHGPGMMWGSGWSGGMWMMVSFFVMFVLVTGAIFLIIMLISSSKRFSNLGAKNAPDKSGTALEILRERFAKGEIEAKEFEEKRRVLME